LANNIDYGILNADGKPHSDAHLAIPSFNEGDKAFADLRNLKFTNVLNDGQLINSKEVSRAFLVDCR
jgi:hypothetical protein